MRGRRGRRAPLWALALLGVLVTPQHYRRDLHTANEATRVYEAVALGVHGTAYLEPVFDRYAPGWRARGAPPTLDAARVEGRYTLDKAPGVTLLAAPVAAAAQAAGLDPGAPASYPWFTWVLTLLLAAAPTTWFAWALRQRLVGLAPPAGGRRGGPVAAWVAAPLVLSTPWLAYGGLLFGHALAAALAGLGALAALGPWESLPGEASPREPPRESPDPEAPDDNGSGRRVRLPAFLGGLALGGAVVTEYPVALVVLATLVALAVDRGRRGRLPWVILGGALPLAVLLAWNTLVFGAPTALSYHFKAFGLHARIHAQGLYGVTWPDARRLWELTLGSQRGLLFQAPWLVLGVWGAARAAGDHRLARAWRVALPLMGLGLPVALSGFVDWRAGDALGPRHWLPALPFLGMGAAWWAATRRETPAPEGRPASAPQRDLLPPLALGALAGLVVSSTLVAIIGAWVSPYFGAQVRNPLFEVNLPILLQGGAAPTAWELGTQGPSGLSGVAAGTVSWPWIVGAVGVLALATGELVQLLWARTRGRRTLAAVALVGAAALHLALTAGPTTGAPPRPPTGEGQARLAPAVLEARATTWEILGHPRRAQALRRALRSPGTGPP